MKIQENKKRTKLVEFTSIQTGDVFRYEGGLFLRISSGVSYNVFVIRPTGPSGTPTNSLTTFTQGAIEVVDATLVVQDV